MSSICTYVCKLHTCNRRWWYDTGVIGGGVGGERVAASIWSIVGNEGLGFNDVTQDETCLTLFCAVQLPTSACYLPLYTLATPATPVSEQFQTTFTVNAASEQFQKSFRAISEQFQSSFRATAEKFPSSFRAIAEKFPSSFRAVSEQFQTNVRAVSEQFQKSFRAISERFQSSFRAVSEEFQKSFRAVSEQF